MIRKRQIIIGILTAVVFWPGQAYPQTQVDETVSSHIRDLKHKDPTARSGAAVNLGLLKQQAAPAVPALIEALSDPESLVRRNAASALASIGPPAKSAVPALTEFLAHENDAYARHTALETLAQLAPGVVTNVPDLILGLKSGDAGRRRWSAEALARLNHEAKPALDELIAATKDDNAEVRAAAVEALQNLREAARPAVGALIVTLQDDNAKVRENAAHALAFIGPGTEDAVPHLIKALGDSDHRVRANAARAFTTDWPGAERAVPALVKALDDDDRTFGTQINAGYALEDIARHGHSTIVVAAFLEYLKQPGRRGEWTAIRTLGQIGSDAKSAIPLLEERLKSDDASIKGAAAQAISNIGGPAGEGVRLLIADLHNDDDSIREKAASSLGDMGPAASAAVPDLISMLGDQDRQAFVAFEQSAKQGVAEAQFALGMMYRDGRGIAPDIQAAVSWLQKAADQGHALAQRNLGILYRQGRGLPKDDALAEKWYRQAAKPTNALARLKNETVNQAAYEKALAPHKTGESSDFGPKVKLSLAVTWFDEDATQAYHKQSHGDGAIVGFLDLYNWSRRGGAPYKLTQPETVRLDSLLKALPEGVEFAPLDQKLLVSCRIGEQWTTRCYDNAALPRQVRLLLDLIDAPAATVPFPPQERLTWLAGPEPVMGLSYQPDGSLLSWGRERRLFRWRDGRIAVGGDENPDPLHGHPIAVSADRVVTNEWHQLKLWDLKSGQRVADLGESGDNNDRPGEALFSSDGRTLVMQQYRHHLVQVWDAASGRLRGEIQPGQYFDRSIALSADGQQLALSCSDNTVRIWDVTTLKPKQEIANSHTTCLCFSPDGKSLAGLDPINLVLWDVATGEKRFQTPAGGWSGMLCFTPDGTTIAVRRARRVIKLWDAHDGRVLGIAEGHVAEITSLAISPDGKEMASASEDGTIKIWSIESIIAAD